MTAAACRFKKLDFELNTGQGEYFEVGKRLVCSDFLL